MKCGFTRFESRIVLGVTIRANKDGQAIRLKKVGQRSVALKKSGYE
jgi:hypothetical protein